MKLVDFGLWRDYVGHLDGCFCCPKSVEEEAAYNGLLSVPSMLQGRQWDTCKLNLDKPGCQRYTGYLSSQRNLILGTCPDGRRGPVPCNKKLLKV